jgi:hypothetical protein
VQIADAEPLTPPRTSRMTRAARAQRAGPIVVQARCGDCALEKTQLCATQLFARPTYPNLNDSPGGGCRPAAVLCVSMRQSLRILVIAVTSIRARRHAAAGRLLAQVAGDDGLRCLVSYRVIAGLAYFTHERQPYGNSFGDAVCAATLAILERLKATAADIAIRPTSPPRNT